MANTLPGAPAVPKFDVVTTKPQPAKQITSPLSGTQFPNSKRTR